MLEYDINFFVHPVLVEKLQAKERREVRYAKRAHENDGFHNYSTRSAHPLNHREQNDRWKPSFLRVEQELKE